MDSPDKISAYSNIKKILKKTSRTLYLSFNTLPKPANVVMSVAYLFCRTIDTVIDSTEIDLTTKENFLKDFMNVFNSVEKPEFLRRIKQMTVSISSEHEKELLASFEKIPEVYEKLPEKFKLMIIDVLRSIIEGMKMDLNFFGSATAHNICAFKTPEDLEKYCGFIGGSPGIFWTKVYTEIITKKNLRLGRRLLEEDGKAIGEALQITNILKDISQDLKHGRCYIPEKELFEKNLCLMDLHCLKNIERFKPVVDKWIMWAIDRLDTSERFVGSIPKIEMTLRAAVIWPVYWAMDTLAEIARVNVLDPLIKPKIKRNRIYSTIASTPPLLLSNTAFTKGYRFRRETLIVSIS